jgi:hypothetical protein
MNWGKAVIVILLVFVLFISGLSYFMFTAPKDDYDHRYYEKGLTFDGDYSREQQVIKDHAQPIISIAPNSVEFTFPRAMNGQVKLMRPASDAHDLVYPLNSRAGQPVKIPANKLLKGKWLLVFDWKSNDKAYLYQQEVYIK